MCSRHDANRDAARVDEVHRNATDGVGQRSSPGARRVGQPLDIGFVMSLERHPTKTRPLTAAKDHAGSSGIGASQLQLAGRARDGVEAERLREGLGADQVWFLELQPGDVVDLDHRIRARP